MATVYLASPLGFSPENEMYRRRIKDKLHGEGHTVLDPWDNQEAALAILTAVGIQDFEERTRELSKTGKLVGSLNAECILKSDTLLAVLDGTEPDSGTVSELGFAVGQGKRCYGLRTDIRDVGDLPGFPLNLQVLYFIELSGGELFRNISDINIQEV